MKTIVLGTDLWILRRDCGCVYSMIVEEAITDSDRRRYQRRARAEGLALEKPRAGELLVMECDDATCIGRATRKVSLAKQARAIP